MTVLRHRQIVRLLVRRSHGNPPPSRPVPAGLELAASSHLFAVGRWCEGQLVLL